MVKEEFGKILNYNIDIFICCANELFYNLGLFLHKVRHLVIYPDCHAVGWRSLYKVRQLLWVRIECPHRFLCTSADALPLQILKLCYVQVFSQGE